MSIINADAGKNNNTVITNRRIVMDFTVAHTWLSQRVMIGIARTCEELFKSLSKITEVVLVDIKPVDGVAQLYLIDGITYETTETRIEIHDDDIFLSPDFQIRGVHVPIEQPTISSIPGIGKDTYAVIYDLLPITRPEYFEKPTVEGMPDYVINILKNYNNVICISKTVSDTLNDYYNHGQILPLNISLDLRNDFSNGIKYLTSGWYKDDIGARSTGRSYISFYTSNTNTDLFFSFEYINQTGGKKTELSINSNIICVIDSHDRWKHGALIIKKELLNQDGLQTILFKTDQTDNACKGFGISSFQISSVDQDSTCVSNLLLNPVNVGYVHLGMFEKKYKHSSVDRRLKQFIKNGNVYLMVGTIEPRKGYEIVYSTFLNMWDKGFDGRLCLIGKVGWTMDSFAAKVKNDKWYGNKVIFIEGASDSTLDYAYRNCGALLQASADEGFGLPLIEAGKYGIPILCSDIPVFREVGKENVIYFERNEKGLEYAIYDFLKMGKGMVPNSKNISKLSWDDTANMYMQYFNEKKEWSYKLNPRHNELDVRRKNTKKALLLMTFPVYPPKSGGQARVFGLYKNLAKTIDISIIASSYSGDTFRKKLIAPGLTEIVIPKTEEHQAMEMKLDQKCGVPTGDLSMMLYGDLTPTYAKIAEKEGQDADYIILCHPYNFPLAQRLFPNKPFIYEAQDVEYLIKKEMFSKNEYTLAALNQLYDVEKECCEKSEFILTCSEEDKKSLSELYEIDTDKIIVVPNGVDTSEIVYTDIETRLRLKEQYGLSKEKVGIFMGAWHMPNLKAAETVINTAKKCPMINFILIGGQCDYFKDRDLPTNVGLAGMTSEKEKETIFKLADFALNPMQSGSGTNLKMFDYMAAGIPIISSRFGTRGIENKDVFTIAEDSDLPDACMKIELAELTNSVKKAREYVENTFDWEVISRAYLERIEKCVLNSI